MKITILTFIYIVFMIASYIIAIFWIIRGHNDVGLIFLVLACAIDIKFTIERKQK